MSGRAIDALARIEEDPDAAVAIDRLVGDAAWDRWEILRAARASSARRAPDRADPSRLALFREIATAIDDDPEDLRAANLAASWRDTVEPETLESWRDRARWPSGMRRWVASLYEATPESWERVAAFIEAH